MPECADSTTVVDKTEPDAAHYIPAYVGAGISFSSRTLTAGIDYTFQKWSSIESGSDVIRYKDRNSLVFGLSWTPGRYDVRRYWKKITFQFGASVDDSYLPNADTKMTIGGSGRLFISWMPFMSALSSMSEKIRSTGQDMTDVIAFPTPVNDPASSRNGTFSM